MIQQPDAGLGDDDRAAGARGPGGEGVLAAGERPLADAMPQIMWFCGPDGRVGYVNPRWAEYAGATEAADWPSRVHPDDLPGVSLHWARARRSGERCEMAFRLRRADGAHRWFVRASGEDDGGWVPALALTGYAGEGDGREALLAGFQAHLSKPVDPAALVASVAKLWRRGNGGEGTTP